VSNASVVFLAVDLGASSGRVLGCEFSASSFKLHEVHRFPNFGVAMGEHLLWNLPGLWQEILTGLAKATQHFPGQEIASVGVDTWGVDFALLSPTQELLGLPFHYRDRQTENWMERSFQRVPQAEIYRQTGLQFMPLNSLYQLLALADRQPRLLDLAGHFLMMPDVFHWLLSGQISNEITDVSTSQMYNPTTGQWAWELLEAFGLPAHLFGSLTEAGTSLGHLRKEVSEETRLPFGTRVVLPGTHDTASAVVAVPVDQAKEDSPTWCYISSGTWSLMGVEVDRPIINDLSAELNFTNEAGIDGTTRLLKNIAGLWLVQECRRIWAREGREYSWEQMAAMAEAEPPCQFLIDPDHPSLTAPQHMPETLHQLASAGGGPAPQSDAQILRCAFDSLARRYAQVLEMLQRLIGNRIQTIYIVGGGVRNQLLCQLTADACDRLVVAGPSEATAIGNALIQARTHGLLGDLAQARQYLRQQQERVIYEPRQAEPWRAVLAEN